MSSRRLLMAAHARSSWMGHVGGGLPPLSPGGRVSAGRARASDGYRAHQEQRQGLAEKGRPAGGDPLIRAAQPHCTSRESFAMLTQMRIRASRLENAPSTCYSLDHGPSAGRCQAGARVIAFTAGKGRKGEGIMVEPDIVPCRLCSSAVARDTPICPSCGTEIPWASDKPTWNPRWLRWAGCVGGAVLLILMLLAAWLFMFVPRTPQGHGLDFIPRLGYERRSPAERAHVALLRHTPGWFQPTDRLPIPHSNPGERS